MSITSFHTFVFFPAVELQRDDRQYVEGGRDDRAHHRGDAEVAVAGQPRRQRQTEDQEVGAVHALYHHAAAIAHLHKPDGVDEAQPEDGKGAEDGEDHQPRADRGGEVGGIQTYRMKLLFCKKTQQPCGFQGCFGSHRSSLEILLFSC